jgi:hypothetical protein
MRFFVSSATESAPIKVGKVSLRNTARRTAGVGFRTYCSVGLSVIRPKQTLDLLSFQVANQSDCCPWPHRKDIRASSAS